MATQIESIVRFGFLAGVGSRVAELEKKVGGLEGIERRVNLVVVGVAALVAATLLGVVLNFGISFMGSRPAGPPLLAPLPGAAPMKAPDEGSSPSKSGATAAGDGYVASVAGGVIIVKAKSTIGFEIGDVGVVIRIGSEAGRGAQERYVASIRFIEKHGDTFVVRQLGAHDPIRVGDVVRRARAGGSG